MHHSAIIEAAAVAIATASEARMEREPISAALEFINKRIVERRNTVPALSRVALGLADGGGLFAWATDLDIAAGFELDCEWQGAPFTIAVDASAFRDALKKLEKGADVSLEYLAPDPDSPLSRDREARLIISAGRSRFQLQAHSVEDMPWMIEPKPETVARFSIDAADLARDVKALTPVMGKEETRYYLCGIAFQARGADLCTVATNGSNMAFTRRQLPDGAESIEDSIIPAKAVHAIAHLLKKPAGLVHVAIGEAASGPGRVIFETGGARIVAKLVDGTFPDWEQLYETEAGGELEAIADPDMGPALADDATAKLAKAIGAPLAMATSAKVAIFTAAEFPEFTAISSLAGDRGPAGYAYYCDDAAAARAAEYLRGLASRYELPIVMQPAPCQVPPESPADGDLIIRDGRAVGMTFGRQYVREERAEMRLCYETLTEKRVVLEEGGYVFPDGAYSVFIPRPADAPIIADVSIEVDGLESPVRRKDNGQIELSEARVRALCGPVDTANHVAIEERFFWRGRVLNGFRAPDVGRGKNRRSDRAMLDWYCSNPAHVIAELQPVPTAEGNLAAMTVQAIAQAFADGATGNVTPLPMEEGDAERECIVCHGPVPAGVNTCDDCIAEMEDAPPPPEAPETPVERVEEPRTPATLPEPAPDALSGPQIEPEAALEADPTGMEAAGDVIGAMFAAMNARIEALEAALTRNESQPETESRNENAGEASALRDRIAALEAENAELREELAMETGRANRERDKRRAAVLRSGQWREKYLAKSLQAGGWESRVESLQFTIGDLETRLAAAELEAKEPRAFYEAELDRKQARIVELENQLLEKLSAGRIRFSSPPLTAKPVPALRMIAGGGGAG